MKVLDKLKNLKLRRWGDNIFTDAINRGGEGTGLTGNLLDDWVNAVTQGEYTKYEDIPEADAIRVLTGWRRPTTKYNLSQSSSQFPSCLASIATSINSYYTIVKDGTFIDKDIQI